MDPKLLAPVRFDLGPSRTCPDGRPAAWHPDTGRLEVTRGKVVTVYEVAEIGAEPEEGEAWCRGFAVDKLARNGRPIETHHVRVSSLPGRTTCDCAGFLSEASRRANERAWATGQPMYFTMGCVHADAVARMVWDKVVVPVSKLQTEGV